MTRSPCHGVKDLLQALVDHVPVTLNRHHHSVGLGPLDPGRQRWGATVQRLDDLDVQLGGEGGVAADAEDSDRSTHQLELAEDLDD